MLNVDSKIISKALSEKLKETLPELISQQTVYAKNRHTGKNGKLICHIIIEVTEIRNIEGFLVTMDIEKGFDSLDYNFLYTLEKYGFG